MCFFRCDNPTIVVTWLPKVYQLYGSFAVLDVELGMNIRIKGAGFNYKDTVYLSICEKWRLGQAIINECGAFEIDTAIPNDANLLTLPVWSVKATVGGTVKAYWPLDIYKTLPYPPKMK